MTPADSARAAMLTAITLQERMTTIPPPPPPPRPPDETPPPPVVYTDNEGRFELAGLDAGRYTLAVRKAGFVPSTYGARHAGEPPIAIELEPGGRAEVTVRLARSAGISGRILDQYGEPMEGVLVGAERLIRSDGRLTTRSAGSTTTDDRGEYRIGALAASRYVVNAYVNRGGENVMFFSADADGAVMQEMLSRIPGVSQVRTYFPGVIGLADAEPIEVGAGEERSSVDFSVPAEAAIPALTISFFDAQGKAVPGEATLTNPGSAIQRFVPMLARNPKIAAHIEPGTWTVLARGAAGVGMTEVSVGSGDASVSVTLGKGGRASGRVETDGAPLPGMRLAISAMYPGEIGSVSRWGGTVTTRADGTFQLPDLLGPTTLQVVNPPRGWAMKAMLYNGRDLSDAPIAFKAGTAIDGIRVLMTNRTATLAGAAVDSQGTPVGDYSVLLFPADRALSARRYARWARPNQQGRFAIDDVLPGDYLAIAVADVDDSQWQNADYLDRFRAAATKLTLAESETQSLTMTLAPPQ